MPDGDTTESTPPKNKFIQKLNAGRNIILALTALATAVGSWFRPEDHTVTEASHDYHEEQIVQLSTDFEDLHGQVSQMQGYFKAKWEAQEQKELVAAAKAAATPSRSRRRASTPPPIPEPKVQIEQMQLPDMAPKPRRISKKKLDDVVQQMAK